jgi:phosphomannomutase
LNVEIEQRGRISRPEERFVALSHTTSEVIAELAKKFGLGALRTWVGFGWLSTGVAHAWSSESLPMVAEGRVGDGAEKCHLVFYDTTAMDARRKVNDAALEQSNGFSILGGPPADPLRQLGVDGHVRDKDGTFAALLVTEIAAYAKEHGTDLLSLLADHVYSDPDLGMFVTYYEPDPLDGEYPGIKGDTKKQQILKKTEELFDKACSGGISLGSRKVTSAYKYWTGKYDQINWPGFPDEGLRFYLEPSKYNHVTIRPSGTTNSLRFHVQFHAGPVSRDDVWARWLDLEKEARELITEIRQTIGAPRDE